MGKPARGGAHSCERPLSPRAPHQATQYRNNICWLSTSHVDTNTTYSLALNITSFSAWPIRGSLRGSFGLRNYEMLPLRVSWFPNQRVIGQYPIFATMRCSPSGVSWFPNQRVIGQYPIFATVRCSPSGFSWFPNQRVIGQYPIFATMRCSPSGFSYFPKYNLPCFKKQKSKSFTISFYQKSPVIFPVSSTSILSAAGTFGSPGMVMISPVRATMKPAPAEILRLRTVTSKSVGAPSFV